MYKLTKQGDFPKGNIFSKEWHVRINNHMNYIFQIEHNADYTKNKIKLNHIVIEDNIKIKNPREEFNLPIDVEGIQFNIIIKNGSSELFVNQSQIRREEEQIARPVPVQVAQESVLLNLPPQRQIQQQPALNPDSMFFDELQEYLVLCDSVIESLNQMSAKDKVECIFEQQAIMNNLKEKTQSKEYLELIQKRIDNLSSQLENGINQLNQSINNNQQQQQQKQRLQQQQQQEQQKKQQQQQEQQKQQQEQQKEQQEQSCIICMDKDITHALIPCGHQKYCKQCAQDLLKTKQCALCQDKVVITGIVQIFR